MTSNKKPSATPVTHANQGSIWKFSLRHFSSPAAQSQFGTFIREIIDFLCVFLVCYTYICMYVFTYVYTYIELLKICQAFTILKSLRRALCICATLAGARDWQPQIFHEPRLGPEAKRPWTVWKAVHRAGVRSGKAAAGFGRENTQGSKTRHYLIWNRVCVRSHMLLQQRCVQQCQSQAQLEQEFKLRKCNDYCLCGTTRSYWPGVLAMLFNPSFKYSLFETSPL